MSAVISREEEEEEEFCQTAQSRVKRKREERERERDGRRAQKRYFFRMSQIGRESSEAGMGNT